MRKINLTRQEKAVEDSLLKGEYINVGKNDFEAIAEAIAVRKKDAVLNVRVNSRDLASIRQRAQKLGIKYQTFISEIIHRIAQAH
ncbi:MAG: antitoxin [Candidatus Omnitrophica bacterium]|jgi:predicted DNA binding CopG/RHH family protein|nr:antitoxin [Candidatus Omnitrophota bacterium]MDD3987851.1 antitoxin [Candidatus Omnitrophota bacterium]MDD4982193.1 antitoxin [Candidatus Omnitrophota bacterium]MDD5665592.1 antitoxin [Candidatus Omnitrophota bacterium]